MEHKSHWITYDWIKLFVAIIFLILFLVLILTTKPARPVTGIPLPEYPTASTTWEYHASSQTLRNAQGVELYKLSADALSWQPVIPEDIRAGLPSGYQLSQETGEGWEIKDSDGKQLYTWDSQALRWLSTRAGEEASTSLPAVLPNEEPAAATTPLSAEPTSVSASAEKTILTSTPEPVLKVIETPAIDTVVSEAVISGCEAPVRSRLVIGKSARILSNLNQRSEPALGDNILTVNIAGDVLKVLDGPVCVPYLDSAYFWWQVENPKGIVGWSAENLLSGEGYFLAPLP